MNEKTIQYTASILSILPRVIPEDTISTSGRLMNRDFNRSFNRASIALPSH